MAKAKQSKKVATNGKTKAQPKATGAKKSATKTPAGSGADSPAASSSAAHAAHDALKLLDYGTVIKVPFGKIVRRDNVRGIQPTLDAQQATRESIAATGLQERMTAYQDEDGLYHLISGSQRHVGLEEEGFPADEEIEIVIRERPANRAQSRVLGLAANHKTDLEWPDMARAIGESVGVHDEHGRPISAKAKKAGLKSGEFFSAVECGKKIGLSSGTVDLYARIAAAPYTDLVTIHSLGGTRAHGEIYAKYEPKDRPKMLEHFRRHGSFPSAEPPPRLKAPGAGRPKKDGSATKGRPAAPAPTGSSSSSMPAAPAPTASPAKAPAEPINPRQKTLFVDTISPAGAPAGAPGSLPLVRAANDEGGGPESGGGADTTAARSEADIMDLADHFGIHPALVHLAEAIRLHWQPTPISTWEWEHTHALEDALSVYENAMLSHKAASQG